ncbi:cell division protein DivIVA [Amycolatopsis antarctica]|uniref:cell division protein DivIVA n=1 Tax=Amycolatopsis antarctica TaxID=1854586 RepID=UPI00196A8206|nr:cell division protein DivIVA [Amycolatopsis antarctica]
MAASGRPDRPAQSPGFGITFRGYDQSQVDAQHRRLTAEIAALTRNRDESASSVAELSKALGYTQRELSDAKAALTRMAAGPASSAGMTERVRTMMQLAEEEIAELREKTVADAEATRAAAEQYAVDVRADADEHAAERAAEHERLGAELRAEYDELRATLSGEHAELMATARAEIERLDREASERRAALDADAERVITEREAAAQELAAGLVADARRGLADAEQARTLAARHRGIVAEQLEAAGAAVQEAVARLGASADDVRIPGQSEAATADGDREAAAPPGPGGSARAHPAPQAGTAARPN